MANFDPQMDPALFYGGFKTIQVIDPAVPMPPMVGNNVIDPSRPWKIKVEWELKGFFVPLWLSALGGSWLIEAYATSKGPGPASKRIAFRNEPVGAMVQPKVYSVELDVAAGELKEHTPGPAGPSGIYELSISAFLNSTLPFPGYDIAGFTDGPTIKAEIPA